jgi:GT2 family glycosyltransferase
MGIEVIVVTYNSAAHISLCIASIVANGGTPILVDNGSTDETLGIARRECADVRIIHSGGNVGYGKAINLGFRQTSGEFVVLSNPDVVYSPNSIAPMTGYLRSHPDAGIVGPQQVFPSGEWQRSYGDLPGLWPGFKDAVGINSIKNWMHRCYWPHRLERRPKDVHYLDGAVLVVRSRAFAEIGGFDEKFYFYSEESDFCARAHKAGWRSVFYPKVTVTHVRGGSTQADLRERYMRYLITSQALLATTHLPRWKRPIYYRLERILFIRLALTFRVFGCLSRSKQHLRLVQIYDTYARLWREQVGKEPEYEI